MKNSSFLIKGLAGTRTLSGTIPVGGAKNAALKVMAASPLFSDHVSLENVPEIEDAERMAELLETIGMKVETSDHKMKISVPEKISTDLSGKAAEAMRSSIVLTGPVLARTGKVTFPNPGGCNFGNRPIDLFLDGFRRLGAQVKDVGEKYEVTAPDGLMGMEFFFKVQSHTGTETLMMAATLAKGKTILKNCALEPEVKSLADFLNSCGAKITGAGTPTITIEGRGGEPLTSGKKKYITMPDRIETGSFMILGALAGKEITITHCIPEHVEIVTEILRTAGAQIDIGKNTITVSAPEKLTAVNVRTHEYPGLPTDIQAPMGVLLSQCEGESALFETIYENRLAYIPDLISMGAHIKIQDTHRVLITGKTPLVGRNMKAPDLRAGIAFVIAAIIAKSESVIENAYVIDRGYEHLAERLSGIGVKIKKA